MKLYMILALVLFNSCSTKIFVKGECVLRKEKGVLIMTGNNSTTYREIIILDKQVKEDWLAPFFNSSTRLMGEEVRLDFEGLEVLLRFVGIKGAALSFGYNSGYLIEAVS